ncbi:ABC transporter ATP-binding protein [Kroppenstedtia guangzhouensis]|uniref:ABC transporter ATP-binding protein n=1 Tax=Kroppenstedtia guangzhouensis TaxID=1274356 RepID=A0ABQ1H3G7_9BACL|nr:ATP-binding cassette domain-containing protein [Kroppenstedtia guangzhouensis]GGA56915.1 ABC transporter ATP-binding protein [Kroppenstedtia guangzhouensis]
MSSLIVETTGLTKRYKKHEAVNKVDLKVQKGDIYGFLGPNGAGKTTTIRMLLGLIRPTEGEVHLFGENLAENRMSILGKVGSLVETPSYYGHLTGFENLEAMRRLLRVEDPSRIDQVLELVRLTGAKDKAVKDYSLGMKQRLGIAMALLNEPELLILDEPTNGLDPAGIHEIRELIKEMPGKFGMTVLVSSHLLSEVDQIATRVGIIKEGKLIFQDSIEVLRKESRPRLRLVTDSLKQAEKFLRENHYEVMRDGEEALLLTETDMKTSADINRLLVENGFEVCRIEEIKRSLEDIFLELTGKETDSR